MNIESMIQLISQMLLFTLAGTFCLAIFYYARYKMSTVKEVHVALAANAWEGPERRRRSSPQSSSDAAWTGPERRRSFDLHNAVQV